MSEEQRTYYVCDDCGREVKGRKAWPPSGWLAVRETMYVFCPVCSGGDKAERTVRENDIALAELYRPGERGKELTMSNLNFWCPRCEVEVPLKDATSDQCDAEHSVAGCDYPLSLLSPEDLKLTIGRRGGRSVAKGG